MKSTIRVDLGSNDEPVIDVVRITTNDLRDKFLCRFFDRLGYESNLAFVEFLGGDNTNNIEPKTFIRIHTLPIDGDGWYDKLSTAQAASMYEKLGKIIELSKLKTTGTITMLQ